MKTSDFVGRYWHKLTDKEKLWILSESHESWQWLVDNVKQPDWCHYPEALMHQMGCWSLVLNNGDDTWTNITPKFCHRCDCSKWGERKINRRIFINRILRRGKFRKG